MEIGCSKAKTEKIMEKPRVIYKSMKNLVLSIESED